jgi:hypothetical protein
MVEYPVQMETRIQGAQIALKNELQAAQAKSDEGFIL